MFVSTGRCLCRGAPILPPPVPEVDPEAPEAAPTDPVADELVPPNPPLFPARKVKVKIS